MLSNINVDHLNNLPPNKSVKFAKRSSENNESFFSLFSTLVGIADSCSDLNRLCFQTIWNPAVIGKSNPERCNC